MRSTVPGLFSRFKRKLPFKDVFWEMERRKTKYFCRALSKFQEQEREKIRVGSFPSSSYK